MGKFIDLTLSGLTTGAAIAAIGLSLVLIWRATRIVNFAQGGMALVCAYLAYSVTNHSGSYWLGFGSAILAGLVLGAVVERTVIRLVEDKPPLNAVIVTLGLLVLCQAGVGMVYSVDQHPFTYAFDFHGYKIGDRAYQFSPASLFAVLAVVSVAAALYVVFRYTGVGLKMRATAFAPEVSRLLGVRTSRMLTLGWALAAAVGALAAMLATPPFISPNALDGLFVYGFTAAVVGGLDSALGAVVGGLGVGLALTYVSGYSSSNLSTAVALGILVVVLLVRPNGLFSRSTARRI
jgi:branched-chain amino acid transport system permease protein